MIQKFNNNNKLLQQLENKRQNVLNELANGNKPVSAGEFGNMLETLRKIDRMIYNIVMTSNSVSEGTKW